MARILIKLDITPQLDYQKVSMEYSYGSLAIFSGIDYWKNPQLDATRFGKIYYTYYYELPLNDQIFTK